MTDKPTVMRGLAWTGLSFGLRFFSQFLVGVALARLLLPADYGLMAMVAIFINLALVLQDFGVSSALVRWPSLEERQLSSGFWFTLGVGAALGALLALSSPLVALFFSEPRLVALVVVLSAGFVVSALGQVPGAILTRELRFRALAGREVGAQVIAGAAAIAMALGGLGVWSLVFQSLIASTVSATFVWGAVRWRPKAHFALSDIRPIVGFGMNVTGSGLLSFLYRNVDNLLVGKVLGGIALAYYSFSYRILTLALQTIHNVLGRVVFPAFARVQHDHERLRRAYVDAIRHVVSVLGPGLVGLAVLAGPFLQGVYGPRWTAATAVVRILALSGFGQILGSTSGWICKTVGRADLQFRIALVWMPVILLSFAAGLPWGIEGVASAFLAVNVLLLYPTLRPVYRLIDLPMGRVARGLAPIAASLWLMALAMTPLLILLESRTLLPDLPTVAIVGSVGVIVYLGCLWILDAGLVRETWKLLRHLRGGASTPLPAPGSSPVPADRSQEADGKLV